MTRVWVGEGTSGTCAGSTIKGAMHPYSEDLFQGCKKFSIMSKSESELENIRLYNSSCIFFAVSCIEAKLNEWISISHEIEKSKSDFWSEMQELQKTLKLERKWNLIASVHEGTMWNSGSEPFQSFEIITSLRNELVHFKGQLLGKDETPNRKIKSLMTTLGVQSEATFVGDDCSSWSYDLLNSNNLGEWVFRKIETFYNDLHKLLNKP